LSVNYIGITSGFILKTVHFKRTGWNRDFSGNGFC